MASGCTFLVSTSGLHGDPLLPDGETADGEAPDRIPATPAEAAPGDSGATGLASVSARYRDAVLADTPVAFWRLGEMAGARTVANEVVDGPPGLAEGAVQLGVAGAFGGGENTAAEFDGADAKIVVGDRFGFAGTVPFSLEAWVRRAGNGAVLGRIVDKQEGNFAGYRLAVGPDIRCGRCTSGSQCKDARAPSPPADVFFHLACTFSEGVVRVYLDGVEVGTETLPDAIESSNQALAIGARGSSEAFLGTIDEVAVYDRALDPTRIAAHHRAGRP